MKTIEDARPVFFALGQKTLARFVSCGVAVTRTRWKILLRCASQQSSFFVLLAYAFRWGGRGEGFVWHGLSPDAEQELVAARGVVALLVLVVVVVVVVLAALLFCKRFSRW